MSEITRFLRRLTLVLLIVSLLPVMNLAEGEEGSINQAALLHDSRDDLYRTPGGAVPFSGTVTLRFRTAAGDVDAVTLRLYSTADQSQALMPMDVVATTPDGYDLWETTFNVGEAPTVYWYRFLVSKGTQTLFYEDDTRPGEEGLYYPANEGGPGAVYSQSPDLSYEIAVYDPTFYTPEWMRNAVIYQIFPDRFRNGDLSNDPEDGSELFYGYLPLIFHETWNEPPVNFREVMAPNGTMYVNSDFFGGDLAGVIEKLDYLQDLGVTAIYFNPIFAARSNHRYDTTDFKAIDPMLGDMETFEELIAEAGVRGIQIILDGVFNHMSSDGPFFDRYHRFDEDGACESLDSLYRNWFFFVPPGANQPDACVDTPTGATYYVSWAGFDSIPKINSDRPEPRLYFLTGRNSVARFWGQKGIGGWRLDVAGDIDPGGPGNNYWELFRVAVRNQNSEAVIIGEEWGDAAPWLRGDEWDSTMNYRLGMAILGFVRDETYTDADANGDRTLYALLPSETDGLIRSIAEDYPPQAFYAMMNPLGTHDTSRFTFILNNDPQLQKLAALLQFTLPGAPMIYYGDEIALNAPSLADSGGTIQDDPYNRAPYPWPDTDGDYYPPPDEDMLAFYQQIAALRHANPALREGELITLVTDDETGVYAFLRRDKAVGNAALVVLNQGTEDRMVEVSLAGLVPDGLALAPVFGEQTVTTGDTITVDVPANTGNVWTVTAGAPFTAPESPGNFVAQGETDGVILTWDAVEGAAGYMVYRSPVAVGGFEPVTGEIVTDTGYIDESTVNGFRYYYAVAAVGADGLLGDYGQSVLAIPSAAITDLYYLREGDLPTVQLAYGLTAEIQAAIRIDGVTDADGPAAGVLAEAALVPVESDLAEADWLPMQYTGEDDGADVYAATLTPTAAGEYQVLARFSTNAAESWTIVTYDDDTVPGLVIESPDDTTPPDPPAAVEVVQASLSGVVVAWEPTPAEDVVVYRVYRTDAEDITKLLVTVPAEDELKTVDTAVLQDQSYSYAITAVDGALNESAAAVTESVRVERQRVPVTFVVTVPDYTSDGEGGVYIAGDFGVEDVPFWDPDGIPMEQVDETHWTVTLELPEGTRVEYKYARGTWDAVEKGPECEEIANRRLTVTLGEGETSLLKDDDIIQKWRDLDQCG